MSATTPQVTYALDFGLNLTSNIAVVGLGIAAVATVLLTSAYFGWEIAHSEKVVGFVFALSLAMRRKHAGKHRRMSKREWSRVQDMKLIKFFDEQLAIYQREHANPEYAF